MDSNRKIHSSIVLHLSVVACVVGIAFIPLLVAGCSLSTNHGTFVYTPSVEAPVSGS